MNGGNERLEFSASQKIYAALLRAYPRRHREKYGAAMRQLFRDQCRDAWRESGNWGLAKLWLRVLPDWASTSVRERVAALKERKTMSDKLADLSHDRTTPRAAFIRVALTVLLLCCMIATAVAFLLPERYASDSMLLLKYITEHRERPDMAQPVARTEMAKQIIQTELAMFATESVLGPVIDELDLKTVWGKKYANGTPLKTSVAVERLRSRVIVSSVRDESVINIRVVSDDKNEPTMIAEKLIHAYIEHSAKVHSAMSASEVNLENQINGLHLKIAALEKKTMSLQAQLHISKDAIESQSPVEQPYWDAKRELKEQLATYKKLTTDLDQLLSKVIARGHISNISVIQSPTPGYSAINRPRIIFYGVVWGIILGLMAGGLAARLAARRGNGSLPNAITA